MRVLLRYNIFRLVLLPNMTSFSSLIDTFSFLSDWEDKFAYLIDLGKSLPPLDPKYKTDQYLVRGCQSQLWVVISEEHGTVVVNADSDALITKGIAAIICIATSGKTKEEIRTMSFSFLDDIGLHGQLSLSRANGLSSMIQLLKQYCV